MSKDTVEDDLTPEAAGEILVGGVAVNGPPEDRWFRMDNHVVYNALSQMSRSATKVCLALGLYREFETGECYPSIGSLVTLTGLHERSVQRGIAELEKLGVISVRRSKGGRSKQGTMRTNRYRFMAFSPSESGDAQAALSCGEDGTDAGAKSGTGATRTYQRNKPVKNTSYSSRELRSEAVDMATAEWILGLILEIQPGFKRPNLDQWANTIRLMRERDDRTDGDIRDLFWHANRSTFWRGNVLSPDKLREKWDELDINLRKGTYGHHRDGTSQRFGWRPDGGTRSESPARPRDRYGNAEGDRLPLAAAADA